MAEQAGDRLPSRLTAQAGQGFEEWQVGLARAMSLDASPLGDAQPIAIRCLRQEHLDEGRLPDPGLAGHEDDLPGPVRGLLQARTQLAQLPLPAHDGRGWPGTRRRRAAGRVLGRRRADASGKPVAPAVPRLDEARAPRVVDKRSAKLLDARGKRRITDHRVPPHGLEQLLSGDQLPGARDERRQDGSRPGRETDLAPAGPQPSRLRIEAMVVKLTSCPISVLG